MKTTLLLALLLSVLLADAQTKFRDNLDEMVAAADEYEHAIFTLIPRSRDYISYFDVDTKDGHLLVWITANMRYVDQDKQDEIYRNYLKIWKQTKYVNQKHYGRYLEVLYLNPYKGTETIKFVR